MNHAPRHATVEGLRSGQFLLKVKTGLLGERNLWQLFVNLGDHEIVSGDPSHTFRKPTLDMRCFLETSNELLPAFVQFAKFEGNATLVVEETEDDLGIIMEI